MRSRTNRTQTTSTSSLAWQVIGGLCLSQARECWLSASGSQRPLTEENLVFVASLNQRWGVDKIDRLRIVVAHALSSIALPFLATLWF